MKKESHNKIKGIFQDRAVMIISKTKNLVTRTRIDIKLIAVRHRILPKITTEYSKKSKKVTTPKFRFSKRNIIDE